MFELRLRSRNSISYSKLPQDEDSFSDNEIPTLSLAKKNKVVIPPRSTTCNYFLCVNIQFFIFFL